MTRVWIHVLTSLVGGIVGGLAVWVVAVVLPGGESPASEKPAAEARSPGRAASSDESAPLDDIEARLLKLERRSAAAQALGEYAKALAAGGDAGAAARAQGVNPENPVFELAVRSVMDEVEWEKLEEERVERENRRLERAQQMSDRLREKLALNEDQRTRVMQVFMDAMEEFRNLRNPADANAAGRPRGAWRTRAQEIRTASDTKLREILNQQQFANYQELLRSDDELRWWGRFGRGGPERRPQVSP